MLKKNTNFCPEKSSFTSNCLCNRTPSSATAALPLCDGPSCQTEAVRVEEGEESSESAWRTCRGRRGDSRAGNFPIFFCPSLDKIQRGGEDQHILLRFPIIVYIISFCARDSQQQLDTFSIHFVSSCVESQWSNNNTIKCSHLCLHQIQEWYCSFY